MFHRWSAEKELATSKSNSPCKQLCLPFLPCSHLQVLLLTWLWPWSDLCAHQFNSLGLQGGKKKKKEERKKNKRFVLNYLHQGLLQVPLSAEGQGQCWGLDKWAKAVLWRRRSKAFHFAALCFLKNNYHCFLNSFFAIYLSDYPRQKLFLTKTC